MNDELHAAALVKKPLGHNCGLRRDNPKDRFTADHILDSLLRASLVTILSSNRT